MFERKVYGAFSFFRNFLKKMKNCDQIIWLFKIKFVPLWRVFHGYIKLFSAAVVVRCWRFFFMRAYVRA